LGGHKAAFVAVTNSQSNSSSHGIFTPLLETAFDLLERAYALALEMALALYGIHRRRGEAMLNLQPVPHYALEQFALRFRHETNLPFTSTAHKAQSPAHRGEKRSLITPAIALWGEVCPKHRNDRLEIQRLRET
jgi:hypothetical protein